MRKWWLAPLALVFGSILFLFGYIVYLSFVNVPRETLTTFAQPGLTIHTDGAVEECDIVLTGILAEYRLGDKPPFFYTQDLTSRQGLFLNDEQLIQSMSLGWYKGRGEYITYAKNGVRFFVARDLEFVVILMSDGEAGKQIAVAPAATMEEAQTILRCLGEDPWLRYICPWDCDLLLDRST